MSAPIELRLVNQTDDAGESQVVIFQKNLAGSSDLAVAWRVLTTSPGSSVSFAFPFDLTAYASDSFGNFAPPAPAPLGSLLSYTTTRLTPAGNAASSAQVQIRNDASNPMNASVYRDNRSLGTQSGVPANEIATFAMGSAIWIGIVNNMNEGDILDSAILDAVQTQLSLLGIDAADILMSGGGPGGTHVRPHQFTLANVRRA